MVSSCGGGVKTLYATTASTTATAAPPTTANSTTNSTTAAAAASVSSTSPLSSCEELFLSPAPVSWFAAVDDYTNDDDMDCHSHSSSSSNDEEQEAEENLFCCSSSPCFKEEEEPEEEVDNKEEEGKEREVCFDTKPQNHLQKEMVMMRITRQRNDMMACMEHDPVHQSQNQNLGRDNLLGPATNEAQAQTSTFSSCSSSSRGTSLVIASLPVEINHSYHSRSGSQQTQQQPQPQKMRVSNSVGSSSASTTSITITTTTSIGAPLPAPSWKEFSQQVLPAAARELLSASMHRLLYTARVSYATNPWYRHYQYTELHNSSALGYSFYNNNNNNGIMEEFQNLLPQLPPFSSLSWMERQLVQEWRTYRHDDEDDEDHHHNIIHDQAADVHDDDNRHNNIRSHRGVSNEGNNGNKHNHHCSCDDDEGEKDFDLSRTLVPTLVPRPLWQNSDACAACRRVFGPTRLRHHCRHCGYSFCQVHSAWEHPLPQLGYEVAVPERVCQACKFVLEEQAWAERVAWRLARCRDFENQDLAPYFEIGVETLEEAALRVTHAALTMARSIPLGAQATVAVETVDVLRKYGLNGIYTVMLRQEFLAAADLLRKALGINRTAWPLSVHELSAAIFYALAQHRAMRGMNPEREHVIHDYRSRSSSCRFGHQQPRTTMHSSLMVEKEQEEGKIDAINRTNMDSGEDETQRTDRGTGNENDNDNCDEDHALHAPFQPVCDPLPDAALASLIVYAPIALHFIYVEKPVDMQLLAAQQGWRLLYAYLEQEAKPRTDRPASALFVHPEQKIACLAIRGTSTIQDVVTDLRQIPVPFPEDCNNNNNNNSKSEPQVQSPSPSDLSSSTTTAAASSFPCNNNKMEEDWTPIFRGRGVAVCGMAGAAVTLYREHIDSLLFLAKRGYRIRLTGHSLGGAVATLLGVLVYRDLQRECSHLFPGASKIDTEEDDVNEDDDDHESKAPLRVYAFGTPSCVDAQLSDDVSSFVTTVVLHDDCVPRLTPTSCRGLLKHLLHIRETWVKEHMPDDIRAITNRAKTVWAPKWRGSFTLSKSYAASSSLKKYCRKQLQIRKQQIRLLVQEKLLVAGDECTGGSNGGGNGLRNSNFYNNNTTSEVLNTIDERSDDFVVDEPAPNTPSMARRDQLATVVTGLEMTRPSDVSVTNTDCEVSEPRMLVEYLGGGMEKGAEGVVIDGDEFFDPSDSLLEESDDGSESSDDIESSLQESRVKAAVQASNAKDVSEKSTTCTFIKAQPPCCINIANNSNDKNVKPESQVDQCDNESPGPVVVEETPLPKMFIPGKIVHVYSHRGVYRAAYVPRTFRELRRISMAGNMLSDHKTKSYYEALLEVHSVRKAPEYPPRWTAFDEDNTCSCCASRFTWASTSDSEAQEARDKHNCRSCGTLVCDPCSKNRIPLPSIGITVAARICDRCYHDMSGVGRFPGKDSSSFTSTEVVDGKPERNRERRSPVVDDLVYRVQRPGTKMN